MHLSRTPPNFVITYFTLLKTHEFFRIWLLKKSSIVVRRTLGCARLRTLNKQRGIISSNKEKQNKYFQLETLSSSYVWGLKVKCFFFLTFFVSFVTRNVTVWVPGSPRPSFGDKIGMVFVHKNVLFQEASPRHSSLCGKNICGSVWVLGQLWGSFVVLGPGWGSFAVLGPRCTGDHLRHRTYIHTYIHFIFTGIYRVALLS